MLIVLLDIVYSVMDAADSIGGMSQPIFGYDDIVESGVASDDGRARGNSKSRSPVNIRHEKGASNRERNKHNSSHGKADHPQHHARREQTSHGSQAPTHTQRFNNLEMMIVKQNEGIQGAVQAAAAAAAAAIAGLAEIVNGSMVQQQTMAQQMHAVQISSMQNQFLAGFVPAQVVRTTVADVPTPEGPPGLAAGPPRAGVNVGATFVHQNPVPVHIGSDTIANKHLAQSVSKIPVHVGKAITKASVRFEKDVMKLLKAESKLSHDMADIKVLEDLNHGRRYPPGVRPFKSPEEQVELDKCLINALDDDNALIIKIPKGSSRREAMEIVHHTCCRFIKSTAAEGLREHISHLKLKVTRDAFRQRCEKEAAQEKIDSLGLDDPSLVHVDQQQICLKIDKAYREIIEKSES